MCEGKKNQTHPDTFEFLSKNFPEGHHAWADSKLGTGIFLVPAPEVGILEVKKVHVENISYKETTKRGENCLAF